MEWPEYNGSRCIAFCFFSEVIPLMQKWEFSFSPTLSGVPHLFGPAIPFLKDWNFVGNNVLWKGALKVERRQCMRMVGLRLGGGGCSLFPGSFCLSHSPLMRVNEDKSVWV